MRPRVMPGEAHPTRTPHAPYDTPPVLAARQTPEAVCKTSSPPSASGATQSDPTTSDRMRHSHCPFPTLLESDTYADADAGRPSSENTHDHDYDQSHPSHRGHERPPYFHDEWHDGGPPRFPPRVPELGSGRFDRCNGRSDRHASAYQTMDAEQADETFCGISKMPKSNPSKFRDAFIQALKWIDAQLPRKPNENEKQKEQRWLRTILAGWDLNETKQRILDGLNGTDALGLPCNPRTCPAVPAATLRSSEARYEMTPWTDATATQIILCFYRHFFDREEKLDVVSEITGGRIFQGIKDWTTYVKLFREAVESTDGEIQENEHKRLLIANANNMLPKKLKGTSESTMHIHLDDIQSQHSLDELIEEGRKHESKLKRMAYRAHLTGPTPWLADDSAMRVAALGGFDSMSAFHEAAAAAVDKQLAGRRPTTPKDEASYGPEAVPAAEAQAAPERVASLETRLSKVEATSERLEQKQTAQGHELTGIREDVRKLEGTLEGTFEKMMSKMDAGFKDLGGKGGGKGRGDRRDRSNRPDNRECKRCGEKGHLAGNCDADQAAVDAYRAKNKDEGHRSTIATPSSQTSPLVQRSKEEEGQQPDQRYKAWEWEGWTVGRVLRLSRAEPRGHPPDSLRLHEVRGLSEWVAPLGHAATVVIPTEPKSLAEKPTPPITPLAKPTAKPLERTGACGALGHPPDPLHQHVVRGLSEGVAPPGHAVNDAPLADSDTLAEGPPLAAPTPLAQSTAHTLGHGAAAFTPGHPPDPLHQSRRGSGSVRGLSEGVALPGLEEGEDANSKPLAQLTAPPVGRVAAGGAPGHPPWDLLHQSPQSVSVQSISLRGVALPGFEDWDGINPITGKQYVACKCGSQCGCWHPGLLTKRAHHPHTVRGMGQCQAGDKN